MRRALAAALASLLAAAPPHAPVPAAAGAPAPTGPGLPASVHPVREALDLDLDPARERYRGTARIEVRLDAPAEVVWLNARELDVASARIEAGGAALPARVVPGPPGVVGLAPSRPVPAGDAVLALAFEGAVDRARSLGVYAARDGGAWYAYTFFEPEGARRAFPCFDAPGARIPWRLSIRVPRGEAAFANAPLASRADEGDGTRFSFAETRPLPSDLVAFAAGPFDVVDAGSAGAAPLRFVVPRGRGGDTRWAAGVVPRLVAALEAYAAIPYPWGKLDVLAVPDGLGTMEHPGLLAIGASDLLHAGDPAPDRAWAAADLLAHELAHQWFGNLVGPASWDETWLAEGIATYLDAPLADGLDPSWHETAARRAAARRAAMAADLLPSAKRLREPVRAPGDAEASFDPDLTYGKGAAVLAMLEGWAGEERVRAALRRYLAARAGAGVATTEDLAAAVSAEAGADLGAVLLSFVDQAGFPRVEMAARCGARGARLEVAQSPAGPGAADRRWAVPVCLRAGAGAREARVCRVLRGAREEWPLAFCPAWIVPDAGGAGYDLARARPPAPLARLSPSEAAAAASDAAVRVALGELRAGDALALVRPLAGAPDRAEVEASVALARLVRPSRLGAVAAARWQAFVRAAWGVRARAFGLLPVPGEPEDAAALRDLLVPLVAEEGREAGLAGEAGALSRRWLAAPQATTPDVAARALAIAARIGEPALLDALADAARRADDPAARAALLGALARAPDPERVRDALDAAGTLDARDAAAVVEAALGTPEGRGPAGEVVIARLGALAASLRADEVNGLLRSAGDAYCEAADRDRLATLGPRVADVDGAPRALAAALARIDACAATAPRVAGDAARFLAAATPPVSAPRPRP